MGIIITKEIDENGNEVIAAKKTTVSRLPSEEQKEELPRRSLLKHLRQLFVSRGSS